MHFHGVQKKLNTVLGLPFGGDITDVLAQNLFSLALRAFLRDMINKFST